MCSLLLPIGDRGSCGERRLLSNVQGNPDALRPPEGPLAGSERPAIAPNTIEADVEANTKNALQNAQKGSKGIEARVQQLHSILQRPGVPELCRAIELDYNNALKPFLNSFAQRFRQEHGGRPPNNSDILASDDLFTFKQAWARGVNTSGPFSGPLQVNGIEVNPLLPHHPNFGMNLRGEYREVSAAVEEQLREFEAEYNKQLAQARPQPGAALDAFKKNFCDEKNAMLRAQGAAVRLTTNFPGSPRFGIDWIGAERESGGAVPLSNPLAVPSAVPAAPENVRAGSAVDLPRMVASTERQGTHAGGGGIEAAFRGLGALVDRLGKMFGGRAAGAAPPEAGAAAPELHPPSPDDAVEVGRKFLASLIEGTSFQLATGDNNTLVAERLRDYPLTIQCRASALPNLSPQAAEGLQKFLEGGPVHVVVSFLSDRRSLAACTIVAQNGTVLTMDDVSKVVRSCYAHNRGSEFTPKLLGSLTADLGSVLERRFGNPR